MTPIASIVAVGGSPAFLGEVVILIAAAAAIAYLCQQLRLAPVVGYLLAGVTIGPHALGLVRDMAVVEAAAELGVLLLLFTIGIEFSLGHLARIRRVALLGGSLQVLGIIGVVTAVLVATGADLRRAVFAGFLVSLSSTAIVLRLLGDRRETRSPHGEVAIGLLIFQDLAVLAMVLLVPPLAGRGSVEDTVAALLEAALMAVAVVVVARRVMPRILEAVARTCSQEVFLLTVLAICLGMAYGFSRVGVSLSLGAFLAGLMVSESPYSEHALGQILPFETVFLAVFFVSVGMLLDLGFLVRNLGLVLAVVASVVILKTAVTTLAVLALGRRLRFATGIGVMLAQVGVFSFVLERTGRAVGLEAPGPAGAGDQVFLASAVLLLIATPALFGAGLRLAGRAPSLAATRAADTSDDRDTGDARNDRSQGPADRP